MNERRTSVNGGLLSAHGLLGFRDSADLAWPEVPTSPLVLIPMGSIEQHGPHLPLHTDSLIATSTTEHVAVRLRASDPDRPVFIAPPIVYGASGEHQDFPGTISIGHEALQLLLIELVRSLSSWAGRIVIINAHGGNVPTLTKALEVLVREQHAVTWVACATEETDAHAGHTETSLLLHLMPELVDMSRAVEGNTTPIQQLLPKLMTVGVAQVSASGVLGDPRTATAELGEHEFERIVEDVRIRISSGRADHGHCLQRPGVTPER